MKRHIFCAVALASLVTLGCNTSSTPSTTIKPPVATSGHDHESEQHHHPETLAGLLDELSEKYLAIKGAMEKGDTEAAHGPLHDIGHLLESDHAVVPELLKKSSLDDEAKAKFTAATTKLFDEFLKLDGTFHGGPGVEWADLDKNIAPAMEELKGLIK